VPDDGRWNHNIHYHGIVLAAVPTGARRALDVGCGEGMLARRLRPLVPHVTGIDLHEPSLDAALRQSDGVTYLRADLLAAPFPAASFDVVTCVAALHHVDTETGLRHLAALLRPGGTLVVIGLARSRRVRDLPWDVAGWITTTVLRTRRSEWEQPSPICWPPPETFTSMRDVALQILPGATYRRHLLWRYSLVWTRGTDPA
jgi:SAM-dependent methyltransferase